MIDTRRNYIFFRIGAGDASGHTKLNAFDRALLHAGCGNYNLIRISSILPAGVTETDSIDLKEGALLPIAYACLICQPGENVGERISAAVAVGVPDDMEKVGVIMEYEGVCQEEYARDMVLSMVKTAMEDRGYSKYKTLCSSATCVSSKESFDCVFAYVAII